MAHFLSVVLAYFPSSATTAAAHDVKRWRLRILDADQRVTYEEVFGKTVRLLVARRAS